MRLTAIILTAGLLAAPAFAEKYTVEFSVEGGAPFSIVFDDSTKTMSVGEYSSSYTVSDDGKTICGILPESDSETCATFEEVGYEAGHSTTYTATNGNSGTAVLTKVE